MKGRSIGIDALLATLPIKVAVLIPALAPSLNPRSVGRDFAFRTREVTRDRLILLIELFPPFSPGRKAPGSRIYPFVNNDFNARLILLHLRFRVIRGGGSDLILSATQTLKAN